MDPKKPLARDLGQAWRYESLGYTFAFSIILFTGAGYLLDRWLGSLPFLTIGGTLVGAVLAFFWVYLRVMGDKSGAADDPPEGKRS